MVEKAITSYIDALSSITRMMNTPGEEGFKCTECGKPSTVSNPTHFRQCWCEGCKRPLCVPCGNHLSEDPCEYWTNEGPIQMTCSAHQKCQKWIRAKCPIAGTTKPATN